MVRRKLSVRVVMSWFAAFWLFSLSVGAEVGLAVYRSGSLDGISEQGFQRILTSPEVVYVLTQERPPARFISEKTRQRYKLLKKAGKKVILDIFWGPDGDYNWDRFNFPDIALNEQKRQEFFQEVVEPVLKSLGPENLYGVCLMEETGLYYGYEKTVHPYYKVPDIHTPSVRRYSGLLKEETGLDLEMAPIWKDEERFAFWRWACRSLSSAAAHRVFGQYIRSQYPGLKVFQFEGLPDVASLHYTEYQTMSGFFDGSLTDNYSSPEASYWLVADGTMAPKAEIVALVAGYFATPGSDEQVQKIKEARLVSAVKAGMDGVGFFEPDEERIKTMDYENQDVWTFNVAAFNRVKSSVKPVREKPLLIVPTNISVGGFGIHEYLAYANLKNFALLPAAEFRLADLRNYDMVVIFGPNYFGRKAMWDADYMKSRYKVDSLLDARRLNRYVQEGGLLVISGLPLEKGSGLFLTEENFLSGKEVFPAALAIPDDWARENLSLKKEYGPLFPVTGYRYQPGEGMRFLGENVGFLVPYGKGYCLVLPHRPSGKTTISQEERLNYGQFLRDILAGLAKYARKNKLQDCFP
ncbi:MAG: hypothetical protein NC911_01170 [Candidatus Omnitrophica bacterium]|nr:hypothetical protein [Candidatus Omnitrophota bacterium]